MKVQIWHRAPLFSGTLVHVADVEGVMPGAVSDRLEYAYKLTQNIDGSWSQGQHVAGEPNADWHPGITVLVELPLVKGRRLGLRSTSIGDLLVVDGAAWTVAPLGFESADVPA